MGQPGSLVNSLIGLGRKTTALPTIRSSMITYERRSSNGESHQINKEYKDENYEHKSPRNTTRKKVYYGIARVSVRDTGCGIPKEKRERLFQPFTQVSASDTRKHGGTGLGLVISRRLAQLMGGTIYLGPEMNGSNFIATVKSEPPAHLATPRTRQKYFSTIVSARCRLKRLIR